MSPSEKKLLEEALQLPEGTRADLAAALLESLEEKLDDDVEKAWEAEIARRLEDVDSGRVKPIPWQEARKLIFDSLDAAKHR